MNDDTMMDIFNIQARVWIVVELAARDHVDVVSRFREMECELRKYLTRRRLIREEISIDKKRRFIES